ncbi:hypothetical protein AZE42_06690 [Rhizopogon vesiculosus]|uniref:PIN domain-containing protein n=1 Tax=Rhizopogon vesiculosus TaxID=180088 RepID=A0A1J8QRL0_9AGAM|nr:hypothetical protein AZE42_06690 [Rhizopogon vesiculosus]
MRQKRAKAYRKLMHLYSISFGFRQPYQILVDSEMCKIAIDAKLDLIKQLGTVLQGTVKPMITQCCIVELYLQGNTQQPAIDLAKTFERRKCNHREAIPGEECLLSVTEEQSLHPSAPELATIPQDKPLQKKRKGPKGPNPLSIKKKKLPEVSARSYQKSKADVSDLSSSTATLPGQKRKRDSQDDQEGRTAGITDGAEDMPINRKRKRRRKPSAVPPSLP